MEITDQTKIDEILSQDYKSEDIYLFQEDNYSTSQVQSMLEIALLKMTTEERIQYKKQIQTQILNKIRNNISKEIYKNLTPEQKQRRIKYQQKLNDIHINRRRETDKKYKNKKVLCDGSCGKEISIANYRHHRQGKVKSCIPKVPYVPGSNSNSENSSNNSNQ